MLTCWNTKIDEFFWEIERLKMLLFVSKNQCSEESISSLIDNLVSILTNDGTLEYSLCFHLEDILTDWESLLSSCFLRVLVLTTWDSLTLFFLFIQRTK